MVKEELQDLLTEEERNKILYEFNHTEDYYPSNMTIQELFEKQVERTPDNIALVYENKRLTYIELNQRVNQLARCLRKKGLKANTIAGIMVEPSLEMIIGIMGIIKAGGAYLPINPNYPQQRIEYMIKDSGTKHLLTIGSTIDRANFDKVEIINLEDASIYSGDNSNISNINHSEDLAYVIYTSGSTGKSKGVLVEHRSVVNILTQLQKEYPLEENDTYLLKTTYTFDVSVTEIFGWFFEGGRLAILSKGEEREPKKVLAAILKYNVTHINFAPSMLNIFIDSIIEEQIAISNKLKYVFSAGEAISMDIVKKFYSLASQVKLENLYGPTEATIYATRYSLADSVNSVDNVPIGKPLGNIQIHIIDENSRLKPIGEIGEICILGECLARGYLNNYQLTKDKFVDNPFIQGKKMYHTGDLGRWLTDGNIEFLGRIDNQVKIRGIRIELGEIEKTLLKHMKIKETVVVAWDDKDGSKYLCAYYVSKDSLKVSELRELLSKELPDYMIPSYFVKLEEMPLAPNGKIDRKVLPKPEDRVDTGTEYREPRNSIEKKLVNIWQEVLGVKRIGIEDNFLELGGQSLKAVRIITKIQKELNVELQVKDLFNDITIEKLGRYIQSIESITYDPIESVIQDRYYPLSAAQRRIYTIQQLDKYSINYNVPSVFTIEGNLSKGILEKSFMALIKRHESFRTSFEIVDGEIVQKINDAVAFKIEDVQIEEEAIQKEVDKFIKPFDLSQAPLLRVKIAEINESKSILMLDMHHIISDGVSINIFINELSTLYEDKQLTDNKIQYKDYVLWQKKIMESKRIKGYEKYWLNQFQGEIPVLNLHTDYNRPTVQSFKGSNVKCEIGKELTKRLRELSKETNSTVYMVLLAAYNVLLSKYSGQEDIIIGTVTAGRTHADLESIIGVFINTLAIRNYPQGEKSFIEFLEEVKVRFLEAYENQEYQFEDLVEQLDMKRDISRNPLFDTMFITENRDELRFKMKDLKVEPYSYEYNVSKFDLTLTAIEDQEKIILSMEYCTDLFQEETVLRLSKHFINIIENIIDKKSIKLKDIDILSNREKQQILLEFNNTIIDYPGNKTIQQLFEEQVAKTPDNVAIVYENKELTYKELNERANQVGGILRDKGVKPNDLVAIMVERSLDMIVGIIGILKAGGAYLPIDPEYPQDRIKYMLEDSMSRLLLTHKHLLKNIMIVGNIKHVINMDEENIYNQQGKNRNDLSYLENINKSTDLAYVIYTSGSTGKPKGVMIENRNVINYIAAFLDEFKLTEQDTIVQQASFSFDAFTEELYPILVTGGKLIIPNKEDILDIKVFKEIMDKHKATIISCSPLLLNELSKLKLSESMRIYITGGDVLKREYVQSILDSGGTVYNTYGPTEATVCATYYRCTGNEQDNIPIGKPISNYRIFILDNNQKLLPAGVPGELCIAGKGLARGYLNQPELTEEKFIVNPFNLEEKMYKSGDLARWLTDGNIEFLGRIDNQVKIRGYRIELGEIETSLLKHKEIKETVVVARDDKEGNKYLCSYYVSEDSLKVSELRELLLNELPEYMIPSNFVHLNEISLTLNGKVDIKKLLQLDEDIFPTVEYEEPRNEVEKKLVSIWQEVLGVKNIGIEDSFLELGGQSLKAIRVISKIHKELNVELRIKDLFNNVTIKKLGKYIQELEGDIYSSIETVLQEKYYPLSSAQRRIYTVQQLDKYSINYNIPSVFIVEGNLDKKVLKKSFETLIKRHESFRTSFEIVEGEIVQKINDRVVFKIDDVQIEEKDIKNEVDKFIKPFDLSQAPLLRVKIAEVKGSKNILIIDMHHIISDGVSINIFMNELSTLYEDKQLTDNKIQYKDYVLWQKKIMESEKIKRYEKYWLNQFQGEIPVLNLPTDYNRPTVQSFKGSSVKCEIGKELTKRLRELSKETNSTVYMVLLAVYNVLLSKYSGQEDIIIGTVTAGRTHADLEGIIGMFVNTLSIRNYPQGEKPFMKFLEEVKARFLEAYENQEYQFEDLVGQLNVKRDASRNPLFDTMFIIEDSDKSGFEMKDLKVEPYSFEYSVSKFDLTLSAIEDEEKIILSMEYCTELFKEETINRLLEDFKSILYIIADNNQIKNKDICILNNEEKNNLQSQFEILEKFSSMELDF